MEKEAAVKRSILTAVVLASFLTPFMGSAVNLAIPAIGQAFNADTYLLSWVATSYILASAAFLVPFGKYADITGRKKIFVLGIAIFGLFSMLCGLARTIEVLILFRIAQGIGGAMIYSTGVAMLTSAFPPRERGKVLGITVASVYIGLSVSPVLGGTMNHHLGWQSIFFLTAAISFYVMLITARLKGEWAGAKGEKYDLAGALLYTSGLLTLMYGVSSLAATELSRYLIPLGLFKMLIFIWYELKVPQPVLNLRLFSGNITFAFSNLAAMINYSATFGVVFLLSLYLQVAVGYNSQQAGLILLSQPVLMALLSPYAGSLSDRIQPRLVATTGMAMTAFALLVFCFLTDTTPIWLVIGNLAVMGVGFGLFSSPNTNAVMSSVDNRFYGIASSITGTMRLTGQTISMAVATMLLALYVGNVELNQAEPQVIINGVRTGFIVFTATCFAGIFASLARGNVVRETQEGVAQRAENKRG